MDFEKYFFNCSEQYINSIHPGLFNEIHDILSELPKRKTQAEMNRDLFWLLTEKNWSYDSLPVYIKNYSTKDLNRRKLNINAVKLNNKRELCLTTQTLKARWHSDFAKLFGDKLVQLEVQFGKVESMFKDFCGFRIARYEKRLALGIEIVVSDPNKYFSYRKASISGMASFEIAKITLHAIGLDCPIFLVGIKDTILYTQ